LYFDISAPGFSDRVFGALAERFVAALREADRRRVPGRAYYHAGEIPLSEPVAFNRSPEAYSRNADVAPLARDRSDEAVDRAARAVPPPPPPGRPTASLTGPRLNGTPIHSDTHPRPPDQGGAPAGSLERGARGRQGASDFAAVTARGAGGDVPPNYRLHRARR